MKHIVIKSEGLIDTPPIYSCVKCKQWSSIDKGFEDEECEKVCIGAHCKCMNLDKKCPNFHYGDHECPYDSKVPKTNEREWESRMQPKVTIFTDEDTDVQIKAVILFYLEEYWRKLKPEIRQLELDTIARCAEVVDKMCHYQCPMDIQCERCTVLRDAATAITSINKTI